MEKTEIEDYKKAGEIASEVKKFAREIIKKDVLLLDVAERIESKINELGGEIAFPVNLSIDEIAAHYTPCPEDKEKARGLLKVDIGVEVNGRIADTAFSVDLEDSEENKELIKLNEAVLEKAIEIIKPGMRMGEIGTEIQDEVERYNRENDKKIAIVKNLSGHSLGENLIHAGLTISNYRNNNPSILENIGIAIEPFLTTGRGEVVEGSEGEIYMLSKLKSIRDSGARKLLEFIKENYKTKPFCRRWLRDFERVDFLLRLLVREGILHNYPVLVEKTKKPVSQQEHTVLISDIVEVTTK